MAISKLAVLSIFVALVFTLVRAHDSELSALNQLGSKIINLIESHLDEKNRELKKKDEVIAEKEKIISANLDSISLLESEIASFQEYEMLNPEEHVGKAYARALELERQVKDLKRQLEMVNGEKECWVTLANEAEKKAEEVSLKLENFEKIDEEQKTRIRVTEQALQVSKEEMMKAKFEAASKIKELTELLVTTQRNEHVKPAILVEIEKEVKKYIDQVATVTKLQLEKARVVLKPCVEELVRAHQKVQGYVKESLYNNNDELTRVLTTEEFESFTHFVASALLTLSSILLVHIFSAIFWKNQTKKRTQNTNVRPRCASCKGNVWHPYE